MPRFLTLATLVALVGGGLMFLKNFDINGLDKIGLAPKSAASTPTLTGGRAPDAIRIASFNIQVFGDSKAAKPEVMNVLAEVVRMFDVVAIQEIRTKNEGHIAQFVELINSTGQRYDYVVGPRLGRTVSKEQYAFVFDTTRIEVDRGAVYTVADPHDLLHRPPMVAPFRVRGPPSSEAFTFTLINIHTDPDETKTEIDALADVYKAVRNDGRGEDDIILLGDLNVDDKKLGRLGEISDIYAAITGVPTNTRGTKLYDNIVFHRRATTEFTGRAGVLDLMKHFNLTMDQALAVSDHLPIWAEFSVYEGGRTPQIAARPEDGPLSK